MVEQWGAGKTTELAGDTQHHRFGIDAFELDLSFAEIVLHTIEFAKKIVIPEGAAEFAVGYGLKPNVFLFPDNRGDLAIFDRVAIVTGNLGFLTPGARVFQRTCAQEAADMVGTEGRGSSLHTGFP